MKCKWILALAAVCLVAVPAARAGELRARREYRRLARAAAGSAPAPAPAPVPAVERTAVTPPAANSSGPVQRRVVVVSAPRARDVLAVRPINWRAGYGYAYPPLLFGQYQQPAPINTQAARAPAIQGPPPYDPQTTAGAPAEPIMAAPGYKYSYSGRYPGAYAWSSAYNSGYYTGGCYSVNACCRASRRYCTPFGGMFRGWGRGCYVAQAQACPTNCQMGPVPNQVSPPAYGTPTPIPATAPQSPTPTPASPPTPAPPEPVEKKVRPEPQASTFPKLPSFPPDA